MANQKHLAGWNCKSSSDLATACAWRMGQIAAVKYWEIIADNLSKAAWSWGCVSAIDSNGRTIWIADAQAIEK
jgi:hypothetical protein